MSLTPYSYHAVNPTLRPRPHQPQIYETVPLGPPQRSPEFEAAMLQKLADIKAIVEAATATTAQTEAKLTTVERITNPIYRVLKLAF